MKNTVETFGKMIYKLAPEHPGVVRDLLKSVYKFEGTKSRIAPSRPLLPARRYLYNMTANSICRGFGQKGTTALVSIFLPCQVLHAMGIEAVVAEGLSCYLTGAAAADYFIEIAERNGIPETLCSYHRILIGCIEAGVLPRPALILNTTYACDTNQLSFRRIAEYYDIPQYVVDVPDKPTADNLQYVADQLREMTDFIEQHTGKKLDDDTLRQRMLWTQQATQSYRAYLDARATRYIDNCMTSEMMDILATQILLGRRETAKYMSMLAADVARLPEGKRGPRLFWVHVLPNVNGPLRQLLDYTGNVDIVGSDLNTAALLDVDPDKPYQSMARRILESSFNGTIEKRIENSYQYADKLNADGIVYFCHWGCRHTLGGSQYAKTYFEQRGLPTLVLDGDGCDRGRSGDGRAAVRLQAFLEQLEHSTGKDK